MGETGKCPACGLVACVVSQCCDTPEDKCELMCCGADGNNCLRNQLSAERARAKELEAFVRRVAAFNNHEPLCNPIIAAARKLLEPR